MRNTPALHMEGESVIISGMVRDYTTPNELTPRRGGNDKGN